MSTLHPSASRSNRIVQERIAEVREQLNRWRWSIGDLVSAFILDESSTRLRNSYRKSIANVVFSPSNFALLTEARTQLASEPSAPEPSDSRANMNSFISLRALRRELELLMANVIIFGQYTDEVNLEQISRKNTTSQIICTAPTLYQLWITLTAPLRNDSGRDISATDTRFIFFCYIICFTIAPRSANCLARILGVYSHASGVKTRFIGVLHGIGLTEVYKTILSTRHEMAEKAKGFISEFGQRPNITICYDNFEIVHYWQDPDGLTQDMINYGRRLKAREVYLADGNVFDDTQLLISRFFIARAIQQAFPDLDHFNSEPYQQLIRMPVVDILPRRRTVHGTLGPIRYNEGTIEGQYDVLNEIFCSQFRLHPHPTKDEPTAFNDTVDWTRILYLVSGDQKTVQLIRRVQSERADSCQPYDSYQWILAIPALFHLQMNFLWTLQRNFEGKQTTADDSSLYHAKNILGRKHIPSEKPPFHHLQELVNQSFNARIIGLLYVHLREQGVLEANPMDTLSAERTRHRITNVVPDYLRGLSIEQFTKLVEEIRDHCLGPMARSKANNIGDEEFINHLYFLQTAETYLLMEYAIKHADIGLLRRVIARCCYIFIGSGASNYANELLRLHWLVSTDACTPVLQEAILSNCLVNLRGRADSWYPIDRLNEHLNLSLKELLWSRRNSTFTVDHLFDTCTWSATHCQRIQDAVEGLFGEYLSPQHTTRSRAEDIRTLAYNLARRSLVVHQQGRKSSFSPKDLITNGESALQTWVERFNLKNMNDSINVPPPTGLGEMGAGDLVLESDPDW